MTAIRTAVAGIAGELAPAPAIRAAIYCRLSQAGGRSVERQEADGRRIAAEKGWRVVAVYKEIASASPYAKKARREWTALLDAVERGEFDAVILWMEDRSARDVIAAGAFVQTCHKAGLTRLVLPSLDYDLTDQEDVARFYGEVLAGQREAAKISKRTRRARLEEVRNGQRHPGGRRAFGERGHGKHAVPAERVEREREAIREAARRILAGDSLRGIAMDWNGGLDGPQRISPAIGGRWTTQTVRRMLLSPRLAGLREHHGQLHPGTFPAILDREQWEAVRAILTDPARAYTAVGGVPRHLLTGMCFCGVCGARMRPTRESRSGVWVYRCPSPSQGGGQGRSCVIRRAEPVERLILAAVFKAVEEGQEWSRQAADRPSADPTRPHYERLAELTAELDVLDRRIGEAELAEELGRRPQPSSATLRQMAADRDREREQHQAAVTRLQHGRVAAAIPRNLRAQWPKLSLDRQRAILAAMIERIEVHPQGRGKAFDPDAIKVKPRW
jgi:site-specific DNA recombinase